MKQKMSEKQERYVELSKVDLGSVEIDDEGWILVEWRPSLKEVGLQADLEAQSGVRVDFIDSHVWVDREGREHFGPGEKGFDRFKLS